MLQLKIQNAATKKRKKEKEKKFHVPQLRPNAVKESNKY